MRAFLGVLAAGVTIFGVVGAFRLAGAAMPEGAMGWTILGALFVGWAVYAEAER